MKYIKIVNFVALILFFHNILFSQCEPEMVIQNQNLAIGIPHYGNELYLWTYFVNLDGDIVQNCGGDLTIDWGDGHVDVFNNVNISNLRYHKYTMFLFRPEYVIQIHFEPTICNGCYPHPSNGYSASFTYARNSKPTCQAVEYYRNFELIEYRANASIINSLKFKMTINPNPHYNISSWWNIYEASNCDMNDIDTYIDIPLRSASYGTQFNVQSSQIGYPTLQRNKCYIIKHGIYTDNCNWTEKRMKVSLRTAITN